jgi:hypothetical protein
MKRAVKNYKGILIYVFVELKLAVNNKDIYDINFLL